MTAKKRGLRISPVCLLLLLPALILGVYGVVMELGVLPKEISVGVVTIEFFALGENELMILLAKVCFIALPVLFVIVALISLIIGAASGKRVSEYGSGDRKRARESYRGVKNGAPADGFDDRGLMDGEPDGSESADGMENENDFYALRQLERESDARRASKDYAPVQLKDVADNMRLYAASKGVQMPVKTARAILSAVASGRLLVTDDSRGDRSKAVIGSVAHYFGGTVHAHSVGLGCYAAEQLTTAVNADNRVSETGFLLDIYGACLDSESVRFAYLEELDPSAVSAFFSDYREALESESNEKYVPVDKLRRGNGLEYMRDGSVLFPRNLTLVIAPPFGADITKMSEEAIFLDLSDVLPCKAEVYGGAVGENAYPQIRKALDRARESFYLSEEVWKKIDALEAYLSALTGYRMSNRKTRLLERYSSAYLAMGGSEAEAIDSMLSSCVFRELYPKRGRFNVKSEEEDLVEFLEREFGAETVPCSIEIVRRFYGASAKAAERERPEEEKAEETMADSAEVISSDGAAAENTPDAEEVAMKPDERDNEEDGGSAENEAEVTKAGEDTENA